MKTTRRDLLAGLGLLGLGTLLPKPAQATKTNSDSPATCPFRLAVINDEITQDFEQACSIASNDFGLQWIELRSMWNKNVTELSAMQIDDARKILAAHNLKVTDIASPLFKTEWPGAPLADPSQHRDQFKADFDAAAQDKLLDHCIELARAFGTDRIRCFDYWRLADQKPYRAAINAKLADAAARCAKSGMILLLENEMTCNTATGEESAAVLAAIPNKNFMLNWDPGNAAALGVFPYSKGYDVLPKDRIGHCHAKDVIFKPDNKGYDWAPVGAGVIDWTGQLHAFMRDHYAFAVSLETHWRGAGTPEASTRISMDGLKKCLTAAGANC
jgi:sugar phosphate isomerase/epimerase